MRPFTRRSFLTLATGGLLLPRRVRAAAAPERKFLFVFCPGGWDQAMVFAPIFNDSTDHVAGDEATSAGGIPFTTSDARPSVQAFFERWADRTCLINGLQVPSVAHDVCTMLTMTGSSRGLQDDWASIVAGRAAKTYILPNLHVLGPLYPREFPDASIRVGLAGQLPGLIDGSALLRMNPDFRAPGADRDALEESFVRARLDEWAAAASPGLPARVGAAEQLAMERSASLVGRSDELRVEDSESLYSMCSVVVRALANGLSRSGIAAYGTGGNGKWDTHTGNDAGQAELFEVLFRDLDLVLQDLAGEPGEASETLLDETTVVVLSEMGRTPELNSSGGKDHWTWTSAMLIGGGVQGGRTVGAWTDDLNGSPVDLASGEATDSGVTLLPGHLGATLLALADIDPGEFIDPVDGEVIEGVLA